MKLRNAFIAIVICIIAGCSFDRDGWIGKNKDDVIEMQGPPTLLVKFVLSDSENELRVGLYTYASAGDSILEMKCKKTNKSLYFWFKKDSTDWKCIDVLHVKDGTLY